MCSAPQPRPLPRGVSDLGFFMASGAGREPSSQGDQEGIIAPYAAHHTGALMRFAGINGWAVFAAGFASWIFASVYYLAIARRLTAAQGWSARAVGGRPAGLFPFVVALVCQMLTAWTLAGVIGHLGPGQVTARNGLISSLFLWAGLALPILAASHALAGRKLTPIAIDAAQWLGVLAIQGLVIGVMGVQK